MHARRRNNALKSIVIDTRDLRSRVARDNEQFSIAFRTATRPIGVGVESHEAHPVYRFLRCERLDG